MEPSFTGTVSLNIEADDELLEEFAVHVFVTGSTPLPHAKGFRARFDAEPVEGIAVDIYGTGFTGYLKKKPADSAKLFVEFEGQDSIDTGLVYSSNSGPNT